jgi:HK97 family phage prohead protease
MTSSSPALGQVIGYASVFDHKDNQGDSIVRGAFRASLLRWHNRQAMPSLLWQHDLKHPIGRILTLREDAHGLLIHAQLILDVQQAREAFALVQGKAMAGLSIGFRVQQSHIDKSTRTRIITQADLWEISLVTIAANQKAKVHTLKHL